MRRINILFVLFGLLFTVACSEQAGDAKDAEGGEKSAEASELEKKAEEILSKMNTTEKVGQMTQVNLNKILYNKGCGGYCNNDGTIDPALLDTAVNKYQVGSILNAINHAYPQTQWHGIVTQIQDAAMKNPNKIPVIYGIDAIHGTTFTLNSTLFPHNIGVGASRNPEVAKNAAIVTAKEVRASGIRWNFDPVFDIGRNPLWPRFAETFGEDPVVIEKMGVAMIKGYEGDGLTNPTAVASCMKHFIGYSASRSGRDRTPSYIPEIELREYYLPQFQAAVDAGASTIMINSGEVNGIPVHGSKYLLTTILRDELGFDGLVVTDWEDINRLHERHMICPTLKDAVRHGVLAGIDMSMTPHDFKFAKLLKELYDDENETELRARVDESVKRILVLKLKLGLFDNAYPEEDAFDQFGKAEYADIALDAARQTLTLLKNEESNLPIDKGSKVLLLGPNANNIPSLHGCWSYTWQGADYDMSWKSGEKDTSLTLYPESTKSIKEAFEAKIGEGNVICPSVADYEGASNYDVSFVKKNASRADRIVICLGENAYAESPGSIQDLTLDSRQIALAKAAIATGKPVTLVLVEGRPRVISSFVDGVDGVLMAYWPGSKGADAIADAIFGDFNPGGKLPFSYPKTTGDIVLYDHKWTEASVEQSPGKFTTTGYAPQFPFGHGLSYTTFEYSDFKLSSDKMTADQSITVSVTVKNTGDVEGDEVVEVYTRDMYASVTPNLRRLRAFERVTIPAGESKEVSLELSAQDVSFITYGDTVGTFDRVTEPGEFKVMLGGLPCTLSPVQWQEFKNVPCDEALTFTFE